MKILVYRDILTFGIHIHDIMHIHRYIVQTNILFKILNANFYGGGALHAAAMGGMAAGQDMLQPWEGWRRGRTCCSHGRDGGGAGHAAAMVGEGTGGGGLFHSTNKFINIHFEWYGRAEWPQPAWKTLLNFIGQYH
jgi:hypothetical protein